MPGKIFVNYRRDDERAFAARVRDRLAQTFSASAVFMDVDNLMAGQRFDRELEKALAQTDIFLAIIGPRWMELFNERGASGDRDYVREEIAGALKRGITVIPVLIERASLPRADALPDDIRELVLHQKHDVAHEQFGRDVGALIEAIKYARKGRKQEGGAVSAPLWKRGLVTLVSSVILALVVTAGWYNDFRLPWPSPPTDLTAYPSRDAATAEDRARQEAERKKTTEVEREEKKRAAAGADRVRRAEEEARRDAVASLEPGSGKSAKDCPQCPEMVVVPAGSFMMGSPSDEAGREGDDWRKGTESPQLKVTVSSPFAVGKFAVTRGEFAAFLSEAGYRTGSGCTAFQGPNWKMLPDRDWRNPGYSQNDRHPVVCVSADDSISYAAWLSSKTGRAYRLLSEAEREYVTRAGTTTPFWWGSSISPTQANYNYNYSYGGGPKDDPLLRTVPVDAFEANPWGLFNVHGNIWEWTEDCWNPSQVGNPADGSARKRGYCAKNVARGGSFVDGPDMARSAKRHTMTSDNRIVVIGFRVARAVDSAL